MKRTKYILISRNTNKAAASPQVFYSITEGNIFIFVNGLTNVLCVPAVQDLFGVLIPEGEMPPAAP